MSIPFLNHIKNLKIHITLWFLLMCILFSISYLYSDQWLYILIKPLITLKKSNYFIVTDLIEIFYLKLSLSAILSLILSFFSFLFQSWFFLSTGLYKHENKLILKLLSIFIIFLSCSIYFVFCYIIPNAWFFFLNFEKTNHPFLFNFYLEPKLYNYIFFLIKTFGFTILCFHYPLIIFILLSIKIINIHQLTKFRKLFYLKVLIIASLIAPPDIWSQMIIFFILLFLIEFFLIIFYILIQ